MAQKNCNLVWENSSKEIATHKDKIGGSSNADLIKNILSKTHDLEDEIIVIKIPASIITDDESLRNAANNISALTLSGASVIVVHDYTDMIKETLDLFGIEQKTLNATMITDNKTAQIIEMVLSGHINRKIVSALCAAGCNAIGISGKDGNMIEAEKHPLKNKNSSGLFDFAFIGAPSIINPEVLLNLTDNGFLPVITPVAFDSKGATYLLDTNLTVSIVSSVVAAHNLILLEDDLEMKNLGDISLSHFQTALLNDLENPSAKNFIDVITTSLSNNTAFVHLVKASDPDAILNSIFNEEYGTKISAD
jgi:acetylglutamate kinase